jgi:hypothetical protein
MKKLSLDLDALKVESFDATPRAEAPRGTVRGNDSANPTTTCPETTINVVDESGRPCVEFEATPLSLCGWDCVWETSDCG